MSAKTARRRYVPRPAIAASSALTAQKNVRLSRNIAVVRRSFTGDDAHDDGLLSALVGKERFLAQVFDEAERLTSPARGR